jgi:sugar phosphate isomerase/epimerase
VAKEIGSPILGCRIGSIEDRYMHGGIQTHMEAVIKLMRSYRDQALDADIKFAFENHCGDLRSKELLSIIQETGTDICGALFDPANALWAMEDPMQALNILGSSIVCTSVRDVAVWESEEGVAFQGTAIGKGILDFQIFIDTLANKCPGVPLQVETISNSARYIDFLKPGFWKGFPDLPAAEFMEFLKLVKEGSPLVIELPPAGITQKEFDIKLQQSELAQSLEFLRGLKH